MADPEGQSAQTEAFLAAAGWSDAKRVPLAGDASARRYARLIRGSESAVLMENGGPSLPAFLRVADWLDTIGLNPPDRIAADPQTGLALLEDFGDDTFAHRAIQSEADVYDVATDVLLHLFAAQSLDGLNTLTPKAATDLCQIAFEHYMPDRDKDLALDALERVLGSADHTPMVTSLRDYHVENLVWRPQETGVRRAGLLDFQDAVTAPAAYDLASLLTDARRDISATVQGAVIARFAAGTGIARGDLSADVAIWSVQRSLRILGIFARLAVVENKTSYLAYIPRVRTHLQHALDHPVCAEIARHLTLPALDAGS